MLIKIKPNVFSTFVLIYSNHRLRKSVKKREKVVDNMLNKKAIITLSIAGMVSVGTINAFAAKEEPTLMTAPVNLDLENGEMGTFEVVTSIELMDVDGIAEGETFEFEASLVEVEMGEIIEIQAIQINPSLIEVNEDSIIDVNEIEQGTFKVIEGMNIQFIGEPNDNVTESK